MGEWRVTTLKNLNMIRMEEKRTIKKQHKHKQLAFICSLHFGPKNQNFHGFIVKYGPPLKNITYIENSGGMHFRLIA